MLKKRIWVFAMTVFCLMISGCSGNKDGEEARLSLMKTTQPAPIEISNQEKNKSVAYQVREDVKKINEIYDVAVIEGKKQILVAYKVRHLNRFSMKKIEKNLKDRLEKDYPDKSFIVSSDYKIFLETIRLREAMEEDNMSMDEAEKQFKDIIKLKKEMT
ncbi:YhcN/YlaJ family sporulation lipoprotein [Bacillus sp. SD088]|uniref:YhcN/YlaJ family sporulation lipoprotein n=1 Tax=Bacillus sp. SD088 TaxID=2782012 RepID=UPI001A97D0B5|nr:YhcN/YlaJ family sporulation lipoprotein [Bacillus sp. SD088]MBO0994552.1 YhcN/YlaJ family sporulation lipoprotein [Bacillus sp. SD088]